MSTFSTSNRNVNFQGRFSSSLAVATYIFLLFAVSLIFQNNQVTDSDTGTPQPKPWLVEGERIGSHLQSSRYYISHQRQIFGKDSTKSEPVVHIQWRRQSKIYIGGQKNWEGAKCSTFGEQQYFVWDAASQSTKWLNMLWNLVGIAPWPGPSHG